MPHLLDIRLFTTGAHIYPLELADGRWVWAVSEFEDDTFNEHGEIYNPQDSGNTLEELIKPDDEGEE